MGQKCNCICTKDNENTFSFISDAMFTRDDDHSNSKGKSRAFDPNLVNQAGFTNYDNDIHLKSDSKDYLEKYVTRNLKFLLIIQKHIKGWLYRRYYAGHRQELQNMTINLYNGFISRLMTPQLKSLINSYGEFDLTSCVKAVLSYSNSDEKHEIDLVQREIKSKHKMLFHKQLLYSADLRNMYTGSVTIEDKKHGLGKLFMNSGDIYEGTWIDDRFIGCGRLLRSDGSIMQGFFSDFLLKLKGEYRNLDGLYYKGEFKFNIRQGSGTEVTATYKYIGSFYDNKKHGNGKIEYIDTKEIYEGDFLENNITGKGIYIWGNGDKFSGDFYNGKMHGYGEYEWKDGNKYIGDYKHNIKEGRGKFYWTNGRIYEGEFQEGKPHGKGEIFQNDKRYYVEFEDGKLKSKSKIV